MNTQVNLSEICGKLCSYMTAGGRDHWGMDIEHWDWVPGVGLISLLDYGITDGQQAALDYVTEWVERNRGQADGAKVINSLAPYALFPELYRLSGREDYLRKSQEIAHWMLEEAPRTREGALEHTVTEAVDFPEQVWADTVYMAVLFLARLAHATGERRLAQEALQQTILHLRLLQNTDTGLLFHGWDCIRGGHMSGAQWARANAWLTLAIPDIVKGIQGLADIPEELVSRYRDLASGLRAVQAGDGLWHTVLDRSDFYKESSGSAGIACGFFKAVKQGLLDDSYLDTARLTVLGIHPLITAAGEVTMVSGGTPVLGSVSAYNEVPLYPTLYGQGLVLQLLTEWRSLEPEAEGMLRNTGTANAQSNEIAAAADGFDKGRLQ
ncbi:glycoside hydrolase family 88/105 protein [Paenibacillus wynnii]|uniref:glycoside hydrolase family 88/105 protein n=1 Tax=Paenibacillus wynnii TaxID=268407 RepID=UPI002792A250|nr:glycoside hydrolase family 88 protein [Paenibacillus wynnii]MDQ0194211.1 unsaturated rhamnogalacturonyl hydrolase [Paenibacillus wynnii]